MRAMEIPLITVMSMPLLLDSCMRKLPLDQERRLQSKQEGDASSQHRLRSTRKRKSLRPSSPNRTREQQL